MSFETQTTFSSSDTADSEVAVFDRDDRVFPTLLSVYRDQGYEIGYSRGQNDLLASFLESIEDYVRENCQSPQGPREILYGFADFLQRRLGNDATRHEVCDGLGI
jgi:hypothetical protein